MGGWVLVLGGIYQGWAPLDFCSRAEISSFFVCFLRANLSIIRLGTELGGVC